MCIQWQTTVEKCAADCFVHGVVPPDVFPRNFQSTIHLENSGGVNSAGAREIALSGSQFFWKRKHGFNIDPEFFRCYRREILADGVDACLSAKSAAAGNCPEAL